MPDPPSLILASASPRRQELLREWGFDFIVHPADIDESSAPHLLPEELAAHLAMAKAQNVSQRFPTEIVLGADTVVALGDLSVGKAANADEARRILMLLEGTTQVVITGVVVVRMQPAVVKVRTAMSAVQMRRLSRAQIDAYIATNLWQGKAGAYGIQDNDSFVTSTSGSHSNIVGLPMEETSEMLAEVGILPRK